MARPRKRKIVDTVDLTNDDEPAETRPSKSAKPSIPRSSQGSGHDSGYSSSQPFASTQHSQKERDSWIASTQELDENAAGNIPSQGEGDDDDAHESSQLYGAINTDIVGVRYYNGQVSPGEYAIAKREPNNPYDRNAIRIDNVMGHQIGHIGRNMAAKLAPLLDSRELTMEIRLTGDKAFYKCPIGMKLYGPSDPVAQANVKQKMKDSRLPVGELIQAERERKRQEKERQAAIKAAKKAGGVKAGKGAVQFDSSEGDFANLTIPGLGDSSQSMEDIMAQAQTYNPREVGEVVDRFGGSEEDLAALPMANQPSTLATPLLPYQRQGLQWMLNAESPQLPSKGSKDVVQLWKCESNGFYTNIATSFTSKDAPRLASGGILSDDMGLGKTIQVLSLLAADPNRSRQPTLIVSPLSVMSNWSGQATFHMKEKNALRVLVYHGSNRIASSPKDFEDYDLVITTYQTLTYEFMPPGKKKPDVLPRKTGLYSIDWRRVVLDEGHTIRNPKAKMAQAAYSLSATSRWVLTGTPIVNNLKDLYSHVRFLRLPGGLDQFDVFNGTLIRPLKSGDKGASVLLQALISTLCLRRMKDMKFIDLRLPELTSHKYPVKFLPHEREKYEIFQNEAQGLLLKYQNQRQQKGEKTFSHLLEVLLRLRQTCNHWSLAKDRLKVLMEVLEENKVVDLTPENEAALRALLQLKIESQEDCPICLETLHNPVITACGHSFGLDCIDRVIETSHKCPMCRAELAESSTSLVQPATSLGEDEDLPSDIDPDASSSKINALIKILQASFSKDSTTKTVVFSQWTSFLDIVGHQLDTLGISFVRLDGKMSAPQRDAAMDTFASDPKCTILLASLGVCSVGLNLVAANQVILSDSWWAPAIEDQAVDRVHRLGQTRPTKVFRLVMEDRIEEKVLDIQKKKRELTRVAFREEESGRKRRGEEKLGRIGDIETLLK